MSAVDDRRKALVRVLATLGTETDGWPAKAAALVKSNKATVEKDLVALVAGELPLGMPDFEGTPEAHDSIASTVEKIKSDDDAAKAMIGLCAGVLNGKLDPKRVTVANTILGTMRYFTPKAEGSGKGTGGGRGEAGGPITAVPAGPAFDPFAQRSTGTGP